MKPDNDKEFANIRAIADNYKMPFITLPKEYTLSSAISVYADADTHAHATFGAYMEKTLKESVLKMLKESREISMPKIKNVIFNAPATIVFWADGTKTVVKAQDDDKFDPEKGLAMAISKKALGNKGNYCNELKKWLPKEGTLGPCNMLELEAGLAQITEAVSKAIGVSTKNG